MRPNFFEKLLSGKAIETPPSAHEMHELWIHSQRYKGWVYLAENKVNNGFLKVGFTQKDPFTRARTLKTPGVVGKFEILHAIQLVDCIRGETDTHKLLSSYENDGESFLVDVKTAINSLQQIWRRERTALTLFGIEYLLHDRDNARWMQDGFNLNKWLENNKFAERSQSSL